MSSRVRPAAHSENSARVVANPRPSGTTSKPRERTNASAAYEVGWTTDSGSSTCRSASS